MADRVELPQAERCDGCRWWKRIPETMIEWDRSGCESLGECRRYPPVTKGKLSKNVFGEPMALNAYYPVVDNENWCGEFSPTPVPTGG